MATSRVQLTSEAKLRERIEKVGAYRVCAQTLAHSDTCHFVDFQDIKIENILKNNTLITWITLYYTYMNHMVITPS